MKQKEFENHCISCTVRNCTNHSGDKDFCSLKRITVGTQMPRKNETVCTDCKSFQLRSDLMIG